MDNYEIVTLLENCLSGCEKAWNELFVRFHPYIENVCFSILQDRDEAEDASQETWVCVFRNLDSFRRESKFSTWVFEIARNTSSDRLRRLRRDRNRLSAVYRLSPREDHYPSPEQQLESSQQVELLIRAVSDLPYLHRITLQRRVQENEYSQVAADLGIPEATARTRTFYARKRLREKLECCDG